MAGRWWLLLLAAAAAAAALLLLLLVDTVAMLRAAYGRLPSAVSDSRASIAMSLLSGLCWGWVAGAPRRSPHPRPLRRGC